MKNVVSFGSLTFTGKGSQDKTSASVFRLHGQYCSVYWQALSARAHLCEGAAANVGTPARGSKILNRGR